MSAIQHFSYCPRQYALIHCEKTFDENIYTMQGQFVHRNVDREHVMQEEGVRVVTALPIWSDTYGLTGKCDVVEFRNNVPYPVEFKHGRKKSQIHDELQLCAQAMCLEEMFGIPVLQGAIYHYSSRKRREVKFSTKLRDRVVQIAEKIREIAKSTQLPPAVNDDRCTNCSLRESCIPWMTNGYSTYRWQAHLIEKGGERE